MNYIKTYYNIDKAEIHTIYTNNQDSLCKNAYEIKYNLPGRHCYLFIDSNNTELDSRIGISFRILPGKFFWIEDGEQMKGDRPVKDPDEVITDLYISFVDFETGKKQLVNDYLKGDSIYKKYEFTNWWSAISSRGSDGCCQINTHFETLAALIAEYNNSPDFDLFYNGTFIFWFDKTLLDNLQYKPDLITIEIKTLNKRTRKLNHTIGEYKINTN